MDLAAPSRGRGIDADAFVEDVVERCAEPRSNGGHLSTPGGAAAFLHASLAQVDPGHRSCAHRHLENVVRQLGEAPTTAGLFTGAAGLLATVQASSSGTRHHLSLRTSLVSRLATRQQLACRRLLDGLERGGPAHFQTYDLVYGLTGTGRTLLDAATQDDALDRSTREEARAAVVLTTTTLVTLLQPRDQVPSCWMRPQWLTPADRERHPDGQVALGMAHGVAGPLALLSSAHHAGVSSGAVLEAVASTARWLISLATLGADRPRWPRSLEPDGSAAASGLTTDSWCWGTTGVAAALVGAGTALHDDQLVREATGALLALVTTSVPTGLVGTGVCHGLGSMVVALTQLGIELRGSPVAATLARTASSPPDIAAGTSLLDGPIGLACALLPWTERGAGRVPLAPLLALTPTGLVS